MTNIQNVMANLYILGALLAIAIVLLMIVAKKHNR